MPHKCTRCGCEYDEKSPELFSGCRECGSRKFFFIGKLSESHEQKTDNGRRPVLKHRIRTDAARLHQYDKRSEKNVNRGYSPIESIRILEPGSYELNIQKLIESDERVVRLGDEGSYMLDLISMVHQKKRKKWF